MRNYSLEQLLKALLSVKIILMSEFIVWAPWIPEREISNEKLENSVRGMP